MITTQSIGKNTIIKENQTDKYTHKFYLRSVVLNNWVRLSSTNQSGNRKSKENRKACNTSEGGGEREG